MVSSLLMICKPLPLPFSSSWHGNFLALAQPRVIADRRRVFDPHRPDDRDQPEIGVGPVFQGDDGLGQLAISRSLTVVDGVFSQTICTSK